MATIYENFGEKVKNLRKELNLTQEELAERIGRDVRTVVAIEAGKRNTTLKTIHKLAQALRATAAELFSN